METRRREPTPDLFKTLDVARDEGERIAGPPVGFWKDSWIRLKKNRGALLSLAVILFLFAPLMYWAVSACGSYLMMRKWKKR